MYCCNKFTWKFGLSCILIAIQFSNLVRIKAKPSTHTSTNWNTELFYSVSITCGFPFIFHIFSEWFYWNSLFSMLFRMECTHSKYEFLLFDIMHFSHFISCFYFGFFFFIFDDLVEQYDQTLNKLFCNKA